LKILIIGNPDNRRVTFFVEACKENEILCDTFSWIEFLQDPESFREIIFDYDVLKIESFGEDFLVFKMLLLRGAQNAALEKYSFIEEEKIHQLENEKGLIKYSRQAYLGMKWALAEVNNICQGKIKFLNSPDAISKMFDKKETHRCLEQNNISKTAFLGQIDSFSALQNLLRQQKTSQVFIKLAHGSSSSGVMAYRFSKQKHLLKSSVELSQKGGEIKCFNSLKIRTYQKENEVEKIIDELGKENLIVEKWEPKAKLGRETFDLRLVVINQQVGHTVMRCSHSPMTNLHLGNRRGDLLQLIEKIGTKFWEDIKILAIEATNAIEGANVSGVDILIDSNFKKAKVKVPEDEIWQKLRECEQVALHKMLDRQAAEIEARLTKAMKKKNTKRKAAKKKK